jgi:recombination protein RecR
MYNTNIESLIKILGKLPGVGPRQARRFAYALTRHNGILSNELTNTLNSLKGTIFSCSLCGATSLGTGPVCNVCSGENRNPKILTLIANQEDYDSLYTIESYRGMLAIVPFPIKIEMAENINVIEKSYIPKTIEYWIEKGLEEIILAFPISPEGEVMESMMLDYLETIHDKLNENNPSNISGREISITSLGRGMSLGSRLSESDDETIRYAIDNRKRAI